MDIDDVLAERLKKKGISLAEISKRFDKSAMRELISGHNEAAQEFKLMVKELTPKTEFSYRVLDPLGTSPPLSSLNEVDSMFRATPADRPSTQGPLYLSGRLVRGRFCAKPFMTGGVRTVFEDLTGNVVLVVIDNAMCTTAKEEDVWNKYPEGVEVAIKQPDRKPLWKDGTVGWRVSNPADVVPIHDYTLLRNGKSLINIDGLDVNPLKDDSYYQSMVASARKLRVQGDLAFAQKEWSRAATFYTVSAKILESIPADQALLLGIKQKLVRVYGQDIEAWLNSGSYKRALKTADELLKLSPRDTETILKRARSLYEMHDYEEAESCLDELLVSEMGNEAILNACQAMRDRIDTAKGQSRSGIYEFDEIFMKDSSETMKKPECHQYIIIGAVKIRKTRNGRGIFATRDVKAGELLVVSKALAHSKGPPRGGCGPGLLYYGPSCAQSEEQGGTWNWSSKIQDVVVQMIEKAQQSSQYFRQLKRLQPGPDLSIPPKSSFTKDWDDSEDDSLGVLTDPDWREAHLENIHIGLIRDIQTVNGFENGDVYGFASFFNHSCTPNCVHYRVAEHLFVSSSREVRAGEELFIHYFDPFASYLFRQEEGSTLFSCNCPRCDFEGRALEAIPGLKALAHGYRKDFETDSKRKVLNLLSQTPEIVARLDSILSSDDCKNFTQQERDWIKCSFALVYVYTFINNVVKGDVSTVDETLRILTAVDPCNRTILGLLALGHNTGVQRKSDDAKYFKELLQKKSENLYLPVKDNRFAAVQNWAQMCATPLLAVLIEILIEE